MNRPLLEVDDLKMYFPLRRKIFSKERSFIKAVDGVSFSIEKGQTFGLVGESGCGKTTTGKCILKIHKASGGRIIYDGKDITNLKEKDVLKYRRDIQLVFQDPYGSLDPRQSVRSILKESICSSGLRISRENLEGTIKELLSLVELDPSMEDRYPHELSGGQRQRLGIARAIACNPKLIICDEPVSALDVSIQAQIINLFRSLQKQLGLTYLFIAHDLAVVQHIADTIGVMYLGNLVELMPAGDLFGKSLHPYTRALLSAVPSTDYYLEKQREREILVGEVPSPINVPSGCPFHTRCSKCKEICKTEKPTLKTVYDNHKVACHIVMQED